MIKGWRNDPNWVAYYAGIESQKRLDRALQEQLANQRISLARQAQMAEENAKHNAECHARKVASGEIAESDHQQVIN